MKQLILILLVVGFIGCQQNPPITTMILVRHAEKVITEDPNPDLTAEGEIRAKQLAEVLGSVDIDAIYSSDYNRTIQTISPIAISRNLEIKKYDPRELWEFSRRALDSHRGETIVIAGHSNTTPQLINELLGKDEFESLHESEYDWVYVVDVIDIGNIKVKKLKITL